MKAKKKKMILKAWESLEIKEDAEKSYGKPVPLNRKAAINLWKFWQKASIAALASGDACFMDRLYRITRNQYLYLIKTDLLCGGGKSEIGESIFGNSFSKNGVKRKKIKSVRTGRKNKLTHKPAVQNFLNGNLVMSDPSFNRSGLKSLRKLLRKSGRIREF